MLTRTLKALPILGMMLLVFMVFADLADAQEPERAAVEGSVSVQQNDDSIIEVAPNTKFTVYGVVTSNGKCVYATVDDYVIEAAATRAGKDVPVTFEEVVIPGEGLMGVKICPSDGKGFILDDEFTIEAVNGPDKLGYGLWFQAPLETMAAAMTSNDAVQKIAESGPFYNREVAYQGEVATATLVINVPGYELVVAVDDYLVDATASDNARLIIAEIEVANQQLPVYVITRADGSYFAYDSSVTLVYQDTVGGNIGIWPQSQDAMTKVAVTPKLPVEINSAGTTVAPPPASGHAFTAAQYAELQKMITNAVAEAIAAILGGPNAGQ